MRKLEEKCGVFGVYGHNETANITSLALYALQHRGQESVGIATTDGIRLYDEVHMGLVFDAFLDQRKEKCRERINKLKGHIAIGHVRYSTAGGSLLANAQPIIRSNVAIAHNGNLIYVDSKPVSIYMHDNKDSLITTSDTETILHVMENHGGSADLEAILLESLKLVKGAYSLVVMGRDRLIGVRDPFGFRPLSLGELDKAYVLASETCAFDIVGGKFVRDIEPGEMLTISDSSFVSRKLGSSRIAQCIFEHIYFARPDSMLFGESVYEVRKRFGRQLASEHPADADLVMPILDSGTYAALGYSQELGIPYEPCLIRSRNYTERTFIEPFDSIRDFGLRLKHNPVKGMLSEKSIVVVDDSIVRGNTSKKIVRTLKEHAREVHLRISSPRIEYPCFYGIDTPKQKELLAANMSNNEAEDYIGADSLRHLSLEGTLNCVKNKQDFCTACFTGSYPII